MRSWLAQFQIPEEDEFFLRWNEVLVNLCAAVRKLEKNGCSERPLQMLWDAIFYRLYVDFDTKQDFMPQFEQAAEQLLKLCKAVREMNFYVDSEGSVTEVESSIQLPVTGDWHGK